MLMTDRAIEDAMDKGELIISDFSEAGLQGASYDMRIGHEVLVSNTEAVTDPQVTGPVRLQPGEFVLLTTLEKVKLNPDIAGNIGGKTYFTRKGLILLSGLQIDPGFEGCLALAAYNSSPKSIVLEYGEKICSIQFFRLPEAVRKAFDPTSAVELREGRLPRVEKDYFRDLEARSLTDVQQDLRQLVQNVSSLTDSVDAVKEQMRTGFDELRRVVYGLLVTVVVVFLAGLVGILATLLV